MSASLEETFQFDAQGFVLLKGVLSEDECQRYLNVLERLEAKEYDDAWRDDPRVNGRGLPTRQDGDYVRLNGLLRLDPTFDALIAHPEVTTRLHSWMDRPQLINTWSITKHKPSGMGGWHRGLSPIDYAVRNGKVYSRMLNVVFLLTDNRPGDGCLAVVPGAHKANFDLDLAEYRDRDLPGTKEVCGEAGDVLMFSETLLHVGYPKTSDRVRTNLYYNYIEHTYCAAMREHCGGVLGNVRHYWYPPEIRQRFNDEQAAMTEWMTLNDWTFEPEPQLV